MQVKDAVGVITGGAGGLGSGTARMLIEGGGRAAILDLPSSSGAELAAELGDAALFVPVDITDADAVAASVEAVTHRFGRIDLCVNTAGISPAAKLVNRNGELFPLDVFRRTIDINLIGPFDVMRHAARAMTANEPNEIGERGLIVNVSSIAAIEGQRGQAAYSASKGGLVALTLPLARDLGPFGIRVLTVAPGIMDTPMLAGIDDKRRDALLDIHVFPKRLGTPADFGHLVESLMTNTLLNGEVIRFDAATRLA